MLNDVQRQALGAMYINTPGSSLDWSNLVDLQQLEAQDIANRQAKQAAAQELENRSADAGGVPNDYSGSSTGLGGYGQGISPEQANQIVQAEAEAEGLNAYRNEDAVNAVKEGMANFNPGSASAKNRNAFLDKAASNKGTGNARTSIVDLLKSLGIEDTSYGARKKIAIDMGIPEELLRSSAKMNQWLHDRISYQMGDAGKSIDEVIPERAGKAEQTARIAASIAQNYYNPPIYKKGWM